MRTRVYARLREGGEWSPETVQSDITAHPG